MLQYHILFIKKQIKHGKYLMEAVNKKLMNADIFMYSSQKKSFVNIFSECIQYEIQGCYRYFKEVLVISILILTIESITDIDTSLKMYPIQY